MPINIPWFESLDFYDQIKEKNFDPETEKRVIQLHEEGFCVFDPEIDPQLIDAVISDMAGKYKTEGRLNEQRRVLDGWSISENVRKLAILPQVIGFLEKVYGRKPIPFQTLNFEIGSEQKTHSDTVHFNTIPPRFMCGVWVALEDIDENNGPVHYYPGSHKLPIFDMAELGLRGSQAKLPYEFYGFYEDYVERLMKNMGLPRKDLIMKRGEALIWSANLFHGGSKILDTSRTRLSQVTHYYFEDCLYYSPMLSSLADGTIYVRNPADLIIGKTLPISRFFKCASSAGFGTGRVVSMVVSTVLKKAGIVFRKLTNK